MRPRVESASGLPGSNMKCFQAVEVVTIGIAWRSGQFQIRMPSE